MAAIRWIRSVVEQIGSAIAVAVILIVRRRR